MAIHLSGTRLQFSNAPRISSVFESYGFSVRLRVNGLAATQTILEGWIAGAVDWVLRLQILATGAIDMFMRPSTLVNDIHRTSVAGVIAADGLWHVLHFTFNAVFPVHMYVDNVEPGYAFVNEAAIVRPVFTNTSTLYVGGTQAGGADSDFDLAEFAMHDGTNVWEHSKHRASVVQGWDPGFFTDYTEAAASRPGQIFYCKAMGDLAANPLLLPIEEWGGALPAVTGAAPSYVDHPPIIEPGSIWLEAQEENNPAAVGADCMGKRPRGTHLWGRRMSLPHIHHGQVTRR